MKHVSILIVSVLVGVLSISIHAVGTQEELAYLHAKSQLPYKDRFALAVATLTNGSDTALLETALKDVVKIGGNLPNNEAALVAVEALLKRAQRDSRLFQQAYLSKARLCLRLGRTEEGTNLFRHALRHRFTAPKDGGPIHRYYADSLQETGRLALAAAEEYNAVVDYGYIHEDAFLSRFLNRLFLVIRNDADLSAVEDVYPLLHECPERPALREIARALCLICDERYTEAVSLLRNIDEQIVAQTDGQGETAEMFEKAEIPLYIALAQLLNGESPVVVRSTLEEYWSRNEADPQHAFELILAMTHKMERAGETARERMVEVTGFLMDLGFLDNEFMRSQISEEQIAHLLDMHQMGLLAAGRWQEARAVCLQIVQEYFPKCSASANAMRTLGYIQQHYEGDLKGAEETYTRILAEYPNDEWRRRATLDLYNLYMLRGDPPGKLVPLLEELRDSTGDRQHKQMLESLLSTVR